MKAYLAGPIFTYGDLLRNTEWAKKIRDAFPDIDLYSPVENTDINGVEGKKKFAGSKEIACGDNERLNKTIFYLMLKKIRISLATVMFIGLTWLFLDFTGTAHHLVGFMAKAQFL